MTVRTNLDRLVGGAGEETVLARVGEGIVSTIGSAVTHKDVLENPDLISKHLLSKGLDIGRFERRPGVLGEDTEQSVTVLDGLREGELVVTAGAFVLKSEFDKVQMEPAR